MIKILKFPLLIFKFLKNINYIWPNYLLKSKFTLKKNGKKIFSLRNWGGSTAFRGKNFYTKEPETISWINSFNKKCTFIDIGANIGIYSLYAASIKITQIYSFEPCPLNFACLNQNIYDNKFQKKITAYPFALHSIEKISKLYKKNFKFGGSSSTFDRNIGYDGKNFNPAFSVGSYACTLDFFCKKINIVPHYVKIDVDGNELNVIMGMKNNLEKNIKSVLIELNMSFFEHKKIIKLLHDYKFKIVLQGINLKNKKTSNWIFSK